MKKPIPITIISGFLGAGKTTLLNYILSTEHNRKIAVLVNDFGEINIDSELILDIEKEMDNTVSLTNGCICCTLSEDFVESIQELMERPEEIDYIIVEASGVSDPAAIVLSILSSGIRDLIRLENIITLVDAEHVFELAKGRNAELGIAQISVADILILNKVDLIDQNRLLNVRHSLEEILPGARIIESVHGRVPVELVFGLGSFNPDRVLNRGAMEVHVHSHESSHVHSHHHEHDKVFSTWSYKTDKVLSYAKVKRTVKSLPTDIFRAKGILNLDDSPEKRGVLHLVGKRCSLSWGKPWEPEKPYSKFVLIGTPGGVDAKALKEHFDGCLV